MKALKLVGIVVAVVVALALVAVTGLVVKPPKSRPASSEKVEATPERLTRGKYLVENVMSCIYCHSERDLQAFAVPVIAGTEGNGGACEDEKNHMPGRICPSNITSDATGLANWTDGEIIRALREGVSKDGHALFPMMPYPSFKVLSDDDARAVVAYVRTLKPISRATSQTRIAFPVSLFIKNVPAPLEGAVQAPPQTDRLAYGKYLVTIAACSDCHTPRESNGKPKAGMHMAGGTVYGLPTGRVVSSNITPDPETGIGGLSREQFIGRFKSFAGLEVKPAPQGRNTLMPWRSYSGISEEDLGAMYDYLRTVPAVKNTVNQFPDAKG